MGWPGLSSLNPVSWLAAPFIRKEAAARHAVEGEAEEAATSGGAPGTEGPPTQDWWELPGCVQTSLERVGAKHDNFT